jgi:hypothetical protein
VEEEVDIVIVEFTVPLAGGVTGFGLKLAEAPEGKPEAERFTELLKPFMEATVTVVLTELPCVTDPEFGFTLRLKSGVVVTLRV